MPDFSPPRVYAVRLVALATAVFLVTSVATAWQKSANPAFPAPVWTACAIALGGMLLWGRSMWPAFFVPVAASALVSGAPWAFAILGPAAISACLAAACLWLTARNFDTSFGSLRDTTNFLAWGALLPMLLAGLATAAAMSLAGLVPWKSAPAVGLVYGAAYAAGCAILTPAILLVARRRPLAPPTSSVLPLACLAISVWASFSGVLPKSASMMSYAPFPFLVWAAWKGGLPAAVAGALLTVVAAISCSVGGGGPFARADGLATFVQIETYVAVMATTALLAGSAAEATRRENQLRLDAAVCLAESERLKSQLQPHFLFNCLAAIHSLAESNPASARAGIVALADLLRISLDNTQRERVTLEEEMEFVKIYLGLQKLRFEDALDFSLDCGECPRCSLPPMLVQPLVENAIKHGEAKGGRLRVEVSVFSTGDALCVRVGNDSPDTADPPAAWKEGTGLRNLRERLALAYGSEARLVLSRPRPGWIEASISINKSALDEGTGLGG